MLKRLSELLAQLHEATGNGQLTLLPGKSGSMAVIVAWSDGNDHREVAQAFDAQEVATATDEQIADAMDTLIAEVWTQVAKASNISVSDATNRIRQAAAEGRTSLEGIFGAANG